ncbi:putative protein-serine/threonine phosphatase [Helianthus anomalus]
MEFLGQTVSLSATPRCFRHRLGCDMTTMAAIMCKDQMHEIVKEEVENCEEEILWKEIMMKSFAQMDKDISEWSKICDVVGSTAVVAVVAPDKIVVSNCGDLRVVLCRNGVAFPLSTDDKPDRPEELKRIEDADGCVIHWDGVRRVFGVLAMSMGNLYILVISLFTTGLDRPLGPVEPGTAAYTGPVRVSKLF